MITNWCPGTFPFIIPLSHSFLFIFPYTWTLPTSLPSITPTEQPSIIHVPSSLSHPTQALISYAIVLILSPTFPPLTYPLSLYILYPSIKHSSIPLLPILSSLLPVLTWAKYQACFSLPSSIQHQYSFPIYHYPSFPVFLHSPLSLINAS